MDQKELRELERKCIQDEPPFCKAACPIHVDARLFVGHMARGKLRDARKILDKTMPFPAILGRICDHPCETQCRLKESGDAIAVGALERACITHTTSSKKIFKLPPKDTKIAIIGSGLSALTVALDLTKKGYPIHLFDGAPKPGGTLCDIPASLLPREAIDDAITQLKEGGASITMDTPITPERFETLCDTFDAVYLGYDGKNEGPLGTVFPMDKRGLTNRENLFAGGKIKGNSPVYLAAQGRWAATSMDRYLQKVSMTAGRETEGPVPSRLYTNMKDVVPAPKKMPASPETGYTSDEAEIEARRCIQCECLECVKVCAYLEKHKGSPKAYVRQIYNNLSIVKGTRTINTLINSCNLCGLCETVCPTGFSMADVCHTTRQHMVQIGKMPPSAHEFALLDMTFSNSDDFFLTRHAPEETKSQWLFFPGCQLGGSSPQHVTDAYAYLRKNLHPQTGLMLACCGAPAHWGGDDARLASVMEKIKGAWTTMGKPGLITACSSCQSIFTQFLPEAETVSIWDIMAEKGLPAGSQGTQSQMMPLAIIDPCTARHEKGVQKSVRSLLTDLGTKVEELEHSGEHTECCGFGGNMSNADPAVADEILKRRISQSPLDYVAYCIVCRDHLASAGKRVHHILDLIWPEHTAPNPGFSMRQENRLRLKSTLRETLWHEKCPEAEAYRRIPLQISEDALKTIEGRRILKEDIQKVLHHVKNGGKGLKNPKNGHRLAFYKPLKVTFWVEYEERDDLFVIHNAYCHRMTVAEGGR